MLIDFSSTVLSHIRISVPEPLRNMTNREPGTTYGK